MEFFVVGRCSHGDRKALHIWGKGGGLGIGTATEDQFTRYIKERGLRGWEKRAAAAQHVKRRMLNYRLNIVHVEDGKIVRIEKWHDEEFKLK